MRIGDIVYYAQIMPTIPLFEVIELKVRTINETNSNDRWFVGIDKHSKHAYMFESDSINNSIFLNRKDALQIVKREEQKCNKKDNDERLYEEY